MDYKVFGLGMSRTGTTTLGNCLEILGYNVTDNNFELCKDIKNNNYNNLWKVIDKFDAFEDNPYPFVYKEVYKKYPNAKYILTTHIDSKSWLKSYIRHCIYGKRKTLWNSVRHNQILYNIPHPVNNEKEFISLYENHNKKVRNFFKDKDNFIEICWMKGDGWNKLCKFLDKPIPNVPFPHKYKSDWKMYDKTYRIARKHPDKFFPTYNGEEQYGGN